MKPAHSRADARAKGPDGPGQRPPPLVRDLRTIARLYGEVFWMLGQRLHYGRDWEEKLAHRALMLDEEVVRRDDSALHRHN